MAVLLEYLGNCIELAPGETIVGRSIGCRIRFNDAAISRQHIRFLIEGNRALIEDLGSKNGTLLNGKPMQGAKPLNDGDEVCIGFKVLRVRLVSDPERELEEETQNRGEKWQGGASPRSRAPRDTAVTPVHGSPRVPAQGVPPLAKTVSGQLEVVMVNCPRCRTRAPIDVGVCPDCGYRWPSGRPLSVTQKIRLPEPSDRRSEPRQPVDMPVIYASDMLTFDAVARDLSRGGVFVATELLDDVGTTCRVTLLPDGAPAVEFVGRVCHAITAASGEAGRPPGIGVKFTGMDEEAARWLEGFLK